VITFALEAAGQLGVQNIGAEHLLLGVIRETRGIGAAVLEDLGVDLNENDGHRRIQSFLVQE